MKRLPFEPQPFDELKARFPKAVEGVYKLPPTAEETARDPLRPGLYRKHIFDFKMGLRLIVSVDDFGDGFLRGHVSASVEHDLDLDKHIRRLANKRGVDYADSKFEKIARKEFLKLSGAKNDELQLVGITDRAVHWHWISPHCQKEWLNAEQIDSLIGEGEPYVIQDFKYAADSMLKEHFDLLKKLSEGPNGK